MGTATKTLRIDADSHFFPRSDYGDLTQALPGFSAEALDMLIRDTTVFTDPGARRSGVRATAAGQRTGAGGPARPSGPIGHGQIEDRVTLLPETGFDMQVLISDGIFANPFGSPIARRWEPGLRLAICKAYNNATAAAQRKFPDQFIGTPIVPFSDVEESTKEATRAVKELGLKAITINGNWVGKNYDSLELYPF
jgi:predicted TIM-barrel fold metal-dependent hydrolase